MKRYLLAGLICILLFSCSNKDDRENALTERIIVLESSIDDLKKEILALQQKIDSLQAKQSTKPAATKPAIQNIISLESKPLSIRFSKEHIDGVITRAFTGEVAIKNGIISREKYTKLQNSGKVLVALEISLKNISSSLVNINSEHLFSVQDNQQYSCEPINTEKPLDGDLLPGQQKSGYIAALVEPSHKPVKLKYLYDYTSHTYKDVTLSEIDIFNNL